MKRINPEPIRQVLVRLPDSLDDKLMDVSNGQGVPKAVIVRLAVAQFLGVPTGPFHPAPGYKPFVQEPAAESTAESTAA